MPTSFRPIAHWFGLLSCMSYFDALFKLAYYEWFREIDGHQSMVFPLAQTS